MKYRLLKEIDGENTFWKTQYHLGWFMGWCCVNSVDSVTSNEQKARALFNRLSNGEPATKQEVVCET